MSPTPWWRELPTRVLCGVLGWHRPLYGSWSHDGASAHATCRRCLRPIMQDSQRGWF